MISFRWKKKSKASVVLCKVNMVAFIRKTVRSGSHSGWYRLLFVWRRWTPFGAGSPLVSIKSVINTNLSNSLDWPLLLLLLSKKCFCKRRIFCLTLSFEFSCDHLFFFVDIWKPRRRIVLLLKGVVLEGFQHPSVTSWLVGQTIIPKVDFFFPNL